VAALLSDDTAIIDTVTEVGAIFGALVQYSDDIADALPVLIIQED